MPTAATQLPRMLLAHWIKSFHKITIAFGEAVDIIIVNIGVYYKSSFTKKSLQQ